MVTEEPLPHRCEASQVWVDLILRQTNHRLPDLFRKKAGRLAGGLRAFLRKVNKLSSFQGNSVLGTTMRSARFRSLLKGIAYQAMSGLLIDEFSSLETVSNSAFLEPG